MLNNGGWWLFSENLVNTVSSQRKCKSIKLCSKHSVQWRPNVDEVVIFGAHTHTPLAASLPPSINQSTDRPINQPTNQPINQPDYSHIHWCINLGFHSLIHTRLHSLIHSHNFTHWLAHLIVHAFHHLLTYSPTHSFAQKFARSLNYSHLRVITQSFTHSPTRSSIDTLSNCSYIHPITNL